uniref:hypothetical protein n=1 Tax=Micromonospora sp. RV43 TaxID=1661387 RepID=UPI00064C3C2D
PPAEVPPPATEANPPAPASKKSKLPIILAAAFGAVLLIAIAIGGTLYFVGRNDLTREQAQRECRTAIEREAEARAKRVGGMSDKVLVSVTGVDIHDVWETDKGWSVDGTATILLDDPMLTQMPTAVPLRCDAVASDDGVRTTVNNRS